MHGRGLAGVWGSRAGRLDVGGGINPTVGDPLLNLSVALLVVALLVTLAHARRQAPLWPAVLLAILAALVELVRRAG